jgi:AcrR family transcriptional regulator
MATRARRQGRPPGGSEPIVRSILEATLRQLGDRGFAALSVGEVAQAAGVNKTSIYRRWKHKSGLVVAALMSLRDSHAVRETGDLRQDLVRELRAKAAQVLTARNRKIVRALISFEDTADAVSARTLRQHRYGVTSKLIRNAVQRGELPSETDPSFLTELIVAPLFYRCIVLSEALPRNYIERVVDTVLRGAAGTSSG